MYAASLRNSFIRLTQGLWNKTMPWRCAVLCIPPCLGWGHTESLIPYQFSCPNTHLSQTIFVQAFNLSAGVFWVFPASAPSMRQCETRETGNGLSTSPSLSLFFFFPIFFQNGCFVCVHTPIANVLLLFYSQFGVSGIHMLMTVQCFTFSQINCKDCYREWNMSINSFYFRSDKLLSIQTTHNLCYKLLLFLFMVSLPSILLSMNGQKILSRYHQRWYKRFKFLNWFIVAWS